MHTRVIIIAAGEGTRWGNYLGIPKHLVSVDNETLILRTVRLLTENGINDIHIVGLDESYKVSGSNLYIPIKNDLNFGADKFLSSEVLWNNNGRTITMFGDVYFTNKAIKKIINDSSGSWKVYGRPASSAYTQKKHAEIFANSFFDYEINYLKSCLQYIIDLCEKKIIQRCIAWELYRAMNGAKSEQINEHFIFKNFIVIDDYTDDFDRSTEYDIFLHRWSSRRQFSAAILRPFFSLIIRTKFEIKNYIKLFNFRFFKQ
jgi:hypothetical protein